MPNFHDGEYGLVMPFVVCTSQGGPYDDEAFVAGCYLGEIRTVLDRLRPRERTWTVPTALVPQLDLVAMDEGYTFSHEPWDEHPADWAFATFTRGTDAGQ